MNDTHDALVGRVMGAIAEYRRHAFGESDEPMQVEPDEEEMIRLGIATDIIALCTAARDAEIRERILSDDMSALIERDLQGFADVDLDDDHSAVAESVAATVVHVLGLHGEFASLNFPELREVMGYE